ncbi:wiskott-Aldrich syndrome protein family member 1 [Clonorchis sinensis]|uniref:Wiskott-Aldrich syndrome protein family member 1 n=1 Tax=Clonorchis sinensis TaxID=79923 RepID=G7YP55_CLOSI|nr:wiskott-Aldrich syndrome protein family member 1 [Clonorchis sinensis]
MIMTVLLVRKEQIPILVLTSNLRTGELFVGPPRIGQFVMRLGVKLKPLSIAQIMPLPKHTVQPVRISQVSVPADVDNELEFVSNATLCNLMRQLASISQLATNMFEELTSELSNLAERTMRLQNRLVTLQADVQSMQAGDEDLTANTPPVQLAPFTSKKPADSRGGKTKTKGVANKNAISKPQIVIQQTGVGGNYVPGQAVPVLNTGSTLKPLNSPLVNNYAGKPVPPIAQQQSMEHTLPPPPPPPTLSQSPVSPNYSSCQSSVISNGIPSDKLVNNAGYPQTIAAHPVHQVNGHSSVPSCTPSQTSYHPVHATNPPQHPPPPPLPSDVAFNNLDGHAIDRCDIGGEMAQVVEREFSDREVRSSNPTSASRLPLSGLGQPGSIPALVLPSGGMAVRHRKNATDERCDIDCTLVVLYPKDQSLLILVYSLSHNEADCAFPALKIAE